LINKTDKTAGRPFAVRLKLNALQRRYGGQVALVEPMRWGVSGRTRFRAVGRMKPMVGNLFFPQMLATFGFQNVDEENMPFA
jgi:hypothetical protein